MIDTVFELKGTTFSYHDPKNGKEKNIPLYKCIINEPNKDRLNEFQITSAGRKYELEAANAKEKKDWIEAIKKAQTKLGTPNSQRMNTRNLGNIKTKENIALANGKNVSNEALDDTQAKRRILRSIRQSFVLPWWVSAADIASFLSPMIPVDLSKCIIIMIDYCKYIPCNSEQWLAKIGSKKEANLQNKDITDSNADALGYFLSENNAVTSLDTRYNSTIGLKGSESIANAIITSETIQSFSGIPVSDLKKNKSTMQKIVLWNTGCADTEALVIGSLLTENYTVTMLSMSCNNVGDLGIQGLADGLSRNTALKTLYLSRNLIGDAGAQGIRQALRVNQTIEYLNLRDNKITEKEKNELQNIKKNHQSCQQLQL